MIVVDVIVAIVAGVRGDEDVVVLMAVTRACVNGFCVCSSVAFRAIHFEIITQVEHLRKHLCIKHGWPFKLDSKYEALSTHKTHNQYVCVDL